MAERAYQRVITKGNSLFAWNKLLNIYTTANNVRAAFSIIWAVLDYFNEQGITHYKALPSWLEDNIYKMISKNGLKEIRKAALKEKMKIYPMIDECLKKAELNHVNNFNS